MVGSMDQPTFKNSIITVKIDQIQSFIDQIQTLKYYLF